MNHAKGGHTGGESDRASLASDIEALLTLLHPRVALEQNDRCAIPILFQLTPLDDERQPIEHEATIVVGKNISRRGISFYHERPISHRRARIELVQPGLGPFAAEIDVSWCRFTKPGWYESGGRLVRAVRRSDERAASQPPRAELPRLAGVCGVSTPIGSA